MSDALTTRGASPSRSSESDDEGEDEEDEDGDGDGTLVEGAAACVFIRDAGVLFGASASSDEELDEDEDEEEVAWRRLRFLLRLRGAVGLAVGIWFC